MIVETERLALRQMTEADLPCLRAILQDEETMWAYAHAFDEAEVLQWFERQRQRYRQDGIGLWAVCPKGSDEMIGQCGLTWQDIPGDRVLEIGYLFRRDVWHRGYAAEAARGCRQYAFETLGARRVCSIIREGNIASMNVAIRNGMTICASFIKHYYGMDMPHYIFCVNS